MTPLAPARGPAALFVALAALALCPLGGEAWAQARQPAGGAGGSRGAGALTLGPSQGGERKGAAALTPGPAPAGERKGATGDKRRREAPARVAQKGEGPRGAGAKGAKGAGSKHNRGGATKRKPAHRRGSAPASEASHHLPSLAPTGAAIRCPDDMVAVAGRFCIDRYEATLVEADGGELLSPYYPPHPKLAVTLLESWSRSREDEPEGTLARFMPLPALPAHHQISFRPKAMAWPSSVPSAYVSGELATEACAAAGKRLCKEVEWVTACRGDKNTPFPYGGRYVQNACNVFREDHPARLLHNDFSSGLLDPRLNLVQAEGKDLLRVTGGTPACVSRWGDDGIFDLVGNLDEWVDDAQGVFVGGFYSRATRNGCDARVSAHPRSYFDYSTGVRCCKDP
ncbi:MAG TPA: SUMF1/EgtB/PvdO family nonheme iron enzyme [Polyangiaceae bacterium]|nr:SUMF1/EgtB/PvdO family nonheme iron enzyme [Polyangiaceae bacterium]